MNIQVGVVMGSTSDWETMQHACTTLEELGIAYERRCSPATAPLMMFLPMQPRPVSGPEVIIAGAGGAAHLAGMIAAKTTLPVIGVPMQTKSLGGLDSLLSIVQMPGGVPVATMAIGRAGAVNAALFAAKS